MTELAKPYMLLAEKYPRLAARLVEAETNRTERIGSLPDGARFDGLDELLRHLDEIEQAFAADPPLARIVMLIQRAIADFETALEATIGGYFSVAADAMRDVMEIEMLLLDFTLDPSRIGCWLEASPQERFSQFRPLKLRARLRAGGVKPYSNRQADPDYRAHSSALHVSPVYALGFPEGNP